MTTLDTTSARAFNSSLKKAIQTLTGQKVKVEIINSYNFPKCWVRVVSDSKFTNKFRFAVFDGCYLKREHLLNQEDISYGNINSKFISAHVDEWQRAINIFEAV